MSAFTYPEAIFAGLVQGVSELFPVSSLGHGVLLPAVIGGSWARDMNMTTPNSPYLNILVAAHVGTAIALVVFFWKDWVRIVGGLFTSIRHLRVTTNDQRLAWLLVVGTIPVGIAGILLDKVVEHDLGKPIPAAVFLTLNGAILFAVERIQRNRADDEEFMSALRGSDRSNDDTVYLEPVSATADTTPMGTVTTAMAVDAKLAKLTVAEALGIGAAQILALLPGISRSGSTIVGGLLRGLKHDEAARFAFLLATPAIAGAGIFKLPELLTPEMRGSLGPAMVCLVVSAVAAFVSVRFLTSYFETRTLNPFAIYCLVAGVGCLAYFVIVR
ncbi:MAG TPA: undecaprenyl-diphosphate phosphatase [Pseudonocardiaceae bacterium]|nr:undecaprenyl-diphosphate phosphatase [Pseudonocardiaceae bacterium]